MSHRPDLITNQDGNTLLAALRAAIPDAPALAAPGMAEAPASLAEVAIATAFVSPSGFAAVAPQLDQAARVRLLLGAEPAPEAWRAVRRPGDPPSQAFERREVAEGLRLLEEGLRRERDRMTFTAESRRQLRAMARMLRAGKLETRLCTRAFLHAKATLLDGYEPGIIVGSSNLTRAGLTTNLELNLGCWDTHVFAQARAWFDRLWEDAEPYDLAALFEEPEAEFPPWLVFLRMLFQLYGTDLDAELGEADELPLTRFQRAGVLRARRILSEHGGVIVADEVGLGKTFIAGEILQTAARNFQDALLICPAALRDSTWSRFLREHGISRRVEMRSFDELARDRQFHHPAQRPAATREVLDRDIRDYALVVVDEAHNFRSPDAPYRAGVLRRLLAGPRKKLVLLTATPVNNSLWDLYHLMLFFLKQDGALASKGVIHIKERFREAAAKDPADLSPDLLYPVIDAVTVKRTRAFVKRHFAGDQIRGPDGAMRPIVFPKAVPITVRYDMERAAPGLFAAVADALDPESGARLVTFARYAPDGFLRDRDPEERAGAETAAGLLRSGLLKRFESSVEAFRLSLSRMMREHELFLDALARGKVITTAFLRDLAADEDALEDLLAGSEDLRDATEYDLPALRAAVKHDHEVLRGLESRLAALDHAAEPKLDAVVEELALIVTAARADAVAPAEERTNRKVLLFSYYGDTVAWLRRALEARIEGDKRLSAYRGRIVGVVGGGMEGEEARRSQAVWGFAPESSDAPAGQEDRYDLLITTDVLAEGMNLQQCRNIINYDMPWNPMRLVQRHGRIDRIGSRHPRVFLRTVFPADRLDALLALEERILRKLAQAARSIGVATPPVHGADSGAHVFAETRAEIEKLASGDASLFEGSGGAQTGEEYRQRLRAALDAGRAAITGLPGGAGSGMRKGRRSGVLFCADVALAHEVRSFLRFVPALRDWQPDDSERIEREIGTCLRLVDCTERTARHMPAALGDKVFDHWRRAQADIMAEWDDLSDPVNLQPQVQRLNRQVAGFIRAHPPRAADAAQVSRALDILESPWPFREEAQLRALFREREGTPHARSARLVEWILETGLERFEPAAPLPPIGVSDVRLVCWMALEAEA